MGAVATFSALAEPRRLQIVNLLRDGPRPVGEIADSLGMRQPQASKHLKVLADAGLVTVRPRAQQRIYELHAQPFKDLDTWLNAFRSGWEQRVDKLEGYLQEVREGGER